MQGDVRFICTAADSTFSLSITAAAEVLKPMFKEVDSKAFKPVDIQVGRPAQVRPSPAPAQNPYPRDFILYGPCVDPVLNSAPNNFLTSME